MDENELGPVEFKKPKEQHERPSTKTEPWPGYIDDGSDLYLSALKRLTHNRPTIKPGHPTEWMKKRDGICPEHGLVLAQKHVIPWPILLAMMILSLGTWYDDFPYRCPKCGSLTEPTATE